MQLPPIYASNQGNIKAELHSKTYSLNLNTSSMDSPASTRIYKFNEYFIPILNIATVGNKSSDSPLKLQHKKLRYLGLATLSLFFLSLFVQIISSMQAPSIDLLAICDAGAYFFGVAICICRGLSLIISSNEVNSMLQKLENIFPVTEPDQRKYKLADYSEIILKRNNFNRIIVTSSIVGLVVTPFLQSVFLWIIRGEGYHFRYPLNTWFPFDQNQLVSYLFVYCSQTIAVGFSSLFYLNEELIFSTTVMQMCMHYRYLGELMREIDARTESNNCGNLKKIILYQYALQSIQGDIENIFSASTFIALTTMKASICFFAFILLNSTDRGIIPFIFLMAFTLMYAAYIRCSNATDLENASADLLSSIYDHNWYEGTPKYRKNIVIMMIRANRSVQLKGLKLKYINMEYFKEIIMETYRMFAFVYKLSK